MSLGGGEILVILIIALIVFGPNRLPEIGRQIGGAIREVRRVQDSVRKEISDVIHAPAEGAPSGASAASSHSEQALGEPPSLPPLDPPTSGSFN